MGDYEVGTISFQENVNVPNLSGSGSVLKRLELLEFAITALEKHLIEQKQAINSIHQTLAGTTLFGKD